MYSYVDLVDGRHIVIRLSNGLARNVHCRTAAEAQAMMAGIKENLADEFDIVPTSEGFKYIKKAEIGMAVGV